MARKELKRQIKWGLGTGGETLSSELPVILTLEGIQKALAPGRSVYPPTAVCRECTSHTEKKHSPIYLLAAPQACLLPRPPRVGWPLCCLLSSALCCQLTQQGPLSASSQARHNLGTPHSCTPHPPTHTPCPPPYPPHMLATCTPPPQHPTCPYRPYIPHTPHTCMPHAPPPQHVTFTPPNTLHTPTHIPHAPLLCT